MKKNLIFVLLLSITSCGQSVKQGSNNSQIAGDWKVYEQSAYSISYPPTWELNLSGQMGATLFIFSPLESDNDTFKENINLMIQDLSGLNLDLDNYTEISEEQIRTLMTNSSMVESKRMKNDKGEYHKLIYTGDQGVFHLTYEQYYWIISDKAYILTFTSEQDKYAKYKETGEKILNSFVLKK